MPVQAKYASLLFVQHLDKVESVVDHGVEADVSLLRSHRQPAGPPVELHAPGGPRGHRPHPLAVLVGWLASRRRVDVVQVMLDHQSVETGGK